MFVQGGSPTPHPFSSRPHFVCKFSRQRSTNWSDKGKLFVCLISATLGLRYILFAPYVVLFSRSCCGGLSRSSGWRVCWRRWPKPLNWMLNLSGYTFLYFFGGLECVGHSFACVAHFFIFERCQWFRTQRFAVATNLATHLPTNLITHLHTT